LACGRAVTINNDEDVLPLVDMHHAFSFTFRRHASPMLVSYCDVCGVKESHKLPSDRLFFSILLYQYPTAEFDSSYKRGEPITFAPNQVIKGWTEAMQVMKEGAKWELYIKSELAYGDRGAGGSIPGGSALIFEMELLKYVLICCWRCCYRAVVRLNPSEPTVHSPFPFLLLF
jgi:hypothetical protein